MSDVVLKQLIHCIMMKLLEMCCAKPARGKAFISGSEEYAKMTRSWQALCLLSRFVTKDIAEKVATKVFPAMSYTLHGQIRYFIEVFVIQCTRLHPEIFGKVYIEAIQRTDSSLQHVSSLMIIGGNLTAGRYSNDFFCSKTDPRIKDILCGVLPWLSSTQGFSRAIAQLLCHKLIPLVVDVNAKAAAGEEAKDDAVLRSVYSFLEVNTDMSRLRKRQQNFFDTYDVDSACSFEGLLSIPVDEGEEANPMHMVDAIKDCLADVYKEAHGEDAPLWKQMEDLLLEAGQSNKPECHPEELDEVQNEAALVNFQRKILPIDALDLGIRSFQEHKLFNAAGKKKQSLIVCASLVDKVPNLAGLARTCEIFSAQKLVMPNLLVRKQDDFKSISASANDWIEMEECKEEELLNWLYKKRSEGYVIVGLEQTSSSRCLTKVDFPEKTVLLLGKEKEGIPIEFLSAVDQCIEIPQLGIIRSLNVHVSGAITIWEYTKQMLQKKKKS
jgi:tRNA G18 (ribose-2'-O)-methylase SpoU